MTSRRRFDAVLFDLDGVLVDSEPWWIVVRDEFAREHGRTWDEEDQRATMGANTHAWGAIMRDRLALDDVDQATIEREIVERLVRRYATAEPPRLDGAVEAVRRMAADRPVAIASSAHRDVIEAAVDALGLRGTFGAVVSSDEVPHGKPAPDVYLEAARRLGVDPERCLVVEDSRNGVLAGKAAGMAVVLIPASVAPDPGTDRLADVVLERLADLDPDALPA